MSDGGLRAMEDMYHNCRWCGFNCNGKCAKSSEVFESSNSKEICELVESGKLSEAIKEGLKLPKMRNLESLLEGYGISQKRQKEILQVVGAELEDFIPTMVEGVDDSVGGLLVNTPIEGKALELKDPESFCCKYFCL